MWRIFEWSFSFQAALLLIAAAQALFDWVERNRPPSVTVNVYQPVSVSVTKIDRIEVELLSQELQRLTRILESGNPQYRDDWRKELLQQLKKAYVLETRTRDMELQKIIEQAEAHL